MAKKGCGPGGCAAGPSLGCCGIENVVSVDERGQMVLPKDVRDRAGIRAGDRLALVTWQKDGKVCCIALIKADEFKEMVGGLLGPMIGEMLPARNPMEKKGSKYKGRAKGDSGRD